MTRDHQTLVATMIGRFGRERWNEHVKLAATTVNSIGIACLIGAVVAPFVNPVPPGPAAVVVLLGAGVAIHVAAQQIMRYFRGKE